VPDYALEYSFLDERQAHAPLEASGEGLHGIEVQIRVNRRKHRRFQWLHDAICSSYGLIVEKEMFQPPDLWHSSIILTTS